jgi:apolipoprotein N-acyltransferase
VALRGPMGSWTWLLVPWLWTGTEWLRGSGVLAFSWIHLSQSQAAPGGWLAPAGWLGGLGLGFLMVAFQAGLVTLLLGRRALRLPALGYTAAGRLLLGLLTNPSHREAAEGAPLRVAAIQGNISLADKWEPNFRMENLRRFQHLSETAVSQGAELLVWPETAFPVNLLYDRRAERELRRAALSLGADIVTGFQALAPASAGGYEYRNAAGLIAANGAMEGIYGKEHLLPFGEEIPLADLLTPGLEIDLGQSNFTSGSGVRVFGGARLPLAVFICYEMGFAASVREAAARGARLLVNITNDGWFKHPQAMELHAALSPMRAAENGLPVLRCGNSGVTELIDARGRRIARLPILEEGILVEDLPRSGGPSFYARYGNRCSPLLWLLYGLLAGGIALRLGGRSEPY